MRINVHLTLSPKMDLQELGCGYTCYGLDWAGPGQGGCGRL